ncbi:sulfhydryl oxidase 2 [Tetranychus urticae]|uniref:Sulfhydryl oxidase n=1 Tax=Tetranychus urticae TaxID=32264 RepID=T1KAT6_TETUR|nr:sulfhydryl oxidase 2 [Tetranychus urticae]
MKPVFIHQLICSFIITTLLTLINGIPILYNGNEPGLIILGSSNFSQIIFHQNNTFIVEFYNSWCGHCVRFAPTWKAFAKDIRHWSSVVRVAAIDCAEDSNVKLCSDYNINLFPSVRYFWHNYDFKINGQPLTTNIGNVESLRHDYLNWLHGSWSHGVPQNWPNLNYFDPGNPEELTNITKAALDRDILILVEGEKSHLGREVILDLSPFLDSVIVRRIKTGHSWLNQLNESPLLLPVILKISKDGKPVIFKRPDELGPDHRKVTVETIMSEYNLTYKEIESSSSSSKAFQERLKNQLVAPKLKPTDNIHLSDLYLSIRETLYKQIPLHKSLDSHKLQILKSFISILDDYFPFDSDSPKIFITSLSKWLSTQVHGLEMDDFTSVLDKLNQHNPFPKPQNWITCQGSEPGFRGYPCSLWLLFHTLTVNEYIKTNGEPNDHRVLYTMRDYITNFFSCAECAKHFREMSSNMESSLINPNGSILWLWRAHNIVNRRLAKDLTEDPVHPKTQYPPTSVCNTCWTSDGLRFNETQTFNFLLTRYQSDNLIGLKSHLKPSKSDFINSNPAFESYDHDFQHVGNLWTWPNVILNRMDISLCLLLYVITSCMLLTFCFILSIRKRRRKEHKFRYPMAL